MNELSLELELEQIRRYMEVLKAQVDDQFGIYQEIKNKYYRMLDIMEKKEDQLMQLRDEWQMRKDDYFVEEHNKGEWAK